MPLEEQIKEHERRILRLEDCVDSVEKAVAGIKGSMGTVEMLVKWVIVPLLVIVGGLVGIKLVLP